MRSTDSSEIGHDEIVLPTGKVRKATAFFPLAEAYFTRELRMVACSVTIKGQVVRGWKELQTGKFHPDADNRAFKFLTEIGLFGDDWKAAAETPHTLAMKANRRRSQCHAKDDCAPPKPHPDADPVAWAETVSKYYQFRELDDGLGVHGTVMDSVFYPDPECPNAPYWPTP